MMDETIQTDAAQMQCLLDRFKSHLRLTSNDADADLMAKLQSALTSVGHDVHRVLPSSTVTAVATISSVGSRILLRLRGPVREVTSVSVDGGVLVEGEGYTVKGNLLCIYGNYRDASVEVIYKAGYVTIPSDMWEAVCLRGAGSYANPLDSVQERMRASDILLRPYRYQEWQS